MSRERYIFDVEFKNEQQFMGMDFFIPIIHSKKIVCFVFANSQKYALVKLKNKIKKLSKEVYRNIKVIKAYQGKMGVFENDYKEHFVEG